MTPQPEGRFKKRLIERLRKEIPESWWEYIQQRSIFGTPDILGVASGMFAAVETKTPRGKASRLQLRKLALIEKAGGFASIMTPKNADEEILRFIRHIESTRNRS